MSPRTCVGHLPHLRVRNVIPQRPWPVSSLNCLPSCRRQEVNMNPHPTYDLQVGFDPSQKSSLLLQFLACTHCYSFKHVDDVQDMQTKAVRCNAYGIVLVVERYQEIVDVLCVRVGSVQVGGRELRRSERRCGRNVLWYMSDASSEAARGYIPSIGGCKGGSTRSSRKTSSRSSSR